MGKGQISRGRPGGGSHAAAQAAALLVQAEQCLTGGDAEGALILADRAIALDARNPNGPAQRGNALMRLSRPAAAAAAFETAIHLHPGLPALWMLAGTAHRAAGAHEEAAAAYAGATRLDPGLAGAWHNLGLSLRMTGDLRGAARALRRASALSPQDGAHWNALGSVLHAAGHWRQAADAWRFALRQPDRDAGQTRRRAGWNLCQSLLLQGDISGGWALHHHRPSFPALDRPPFGVPLLAGRPRHGQRILITVEQGLGDVIMVLRFIPLLLEAGVNVVLQRPLALQRLMTGGWFDQVSMLDEGAAPPPVDAQIPCMGLAELFVTEADHVPGPMPYLHPDPALTARWGPIVGAAQGLKVGFVWAGNPAFPGDHARSPRLAPLLPLFSLPGITPVILQHGEGRADLQGISLPSHTVDLGGQGDIADSAAILATLDLLVTSCTMPAHLAGALGLPVALLLPFCPDWRWQIGRADTPWYPATRLYRQQRPGDWQVPVANLARDLTLRIGR